MAKSKTQYVCQSCGAFSPKWVGQCPDCGAWNSMVETVAKAPGSSRAMGGGMTGAALAGRVQKLADVGTQEEPRTSTGMGEMDRVLGGGIVPGAVILIGGDPGIGKSTLLLQVLASLEGRLSTR